MYLIGGIMQPISDSPEMRGIKWGASQRGGTLRTCQQWRVEYLISLDSCSMPDNFFHNLF